MRRNRRALALPAALALTLTACGGDEEGDPRAFCEVTAVGSATQPDDEERFREVVDEYRETAPPAIREDVAAVLDPLEEMLDELAAIEDDDPEAAMETLTNVYEEVDQEAADRVDTWVEENC